MNDVLLSCVAGALREYLLLQEETVSNALEIRVAIPVNLRAQSQMEALGNQFGLVFLCLPVGMENPLEQLYQVHEYIQELEASYQSIVAFGLQGALGMGPELVQQPALDMLSQKATALMTNVPGPKEPLYLAGRRISEMLFWMPQSGNIGMVISLLSYHDHVYFGLMTDRNIVTDPSQITCHFSAAFEKLRSATLLEPAIPSAEGIP